MSDRDRWPSRSKLARAAIVLLLLSAPVFGGCAAAQVRGAKVETARGRHEIIVERLRGELVRDKSTKADVLKALGEPDGTGQFGGWRGVRGPEHAKLGPMEIWYYEDNKVSFAQRLRQEIRVMLVFFKGEVFDGYLWFNNTTTGPYR